MASEKTKQYWVDELDLVQHPEGGYYKEVHRSTDKIIAPKSGKYRSVATSILFLLGQKDVSHFHKIDSDELWYYHAGSTCLVHEITTKGELITHHLGPQVDKGEKLQLCIPAGSVFGSESAGEFSLVGCMVAPGFDFEDFKLYKTSELLTQYPSYEEIIRRFTKENYS